MKPKQKASKEAGSGKRNASKDSDSLPIEIDISQVTGDAKAEGQLSDVDDEEDDKENDDDYRRNKSQMIKLPNNLDEPTLEAMRICSKRMAEESTDILDEDDLVSLTLRISQDAMQRKRFRSDLADSVDEEDALLKHYYEEEEEYILGQDFFREISMLAQEETKVDKRTLNWVKKLTGLVKQKTFLHGLDSQEIENMGSEVRNPQRLTRGMARNQRIKRQEELTFRENLGLKCLIEATHELEQEIGPLLVPKELNISNRRPRKRKRREPKLPTGEDQGHKKNQIDTSSSKPLVARVSSSAAQSALPIRNSRKSQEQVKQSSKDVRVARLLVNGKHVANENIRFKANDARAEADKEANTDKKMRTKSKVTKKSTSVGLKTMTTVKKQPTHAQLDAGTIDDIEDRRKQVSKATTQSTLPATLPDPSENRRTGLASKSDLADWWKNEVSAQSRAIMEKRKRDENTADHLFGKIGVGTQFPRCEPGNPVMTRAAATIKSRKCRHPSRTYAKWSRKLMACINGSARSWARFEFFYSDIDRAWYSANEFLSDIAKLGIYESTKLTRHEWRAVRRMLKHRPRRFSKRWIKAQLNDLEEYRATVRTLQNNPSLTNNTHFEIPAHIKVGSTVTAYNKKFQILHRGTVLFHDPSCSKYLVQFERKELGHELCSDIEVASHGIPEMLHRAPERIIGGFSLRCDMNAENEFGSLPYGTSEGPLDALEPKERLVRLNALEEFYSKAARKQQPTEASQNLIDGDETIHAQVDLAAEREALMELMSTIDIATSRKESILNMMATLSEAKRKDIEKKNKTVSPHLQEYFTWLKANLQVTNLSLEAGMMYMQVLYSKSYSKMPFQDKGQYDQAQKLFPYRFQNLYSDSYDTQPRLSKEWRNEVYLMAIDATRQLDMIFNRNQHNENTPGWHGDKGKISVANELLLTTSYLSNSETNLASRRCMSSAVNCLLDECVNKLAKRDPVPHTSDVNLTRVLEDRALAERELRKSVEAFKAAYTGLPVDRDVA